MKLNIEKYSPTEHLNWMRTKKANFWADLERKRNIQLFKKVSAQVPAYKTFLKKHGIQPKQIKTIEDLEELPAISKKNYLRQYPLSQVCWNGTLKTPLVFTATSGSTGDPFYFPRAGQLDYQASLIHELFLQNNRQSLEGPTLILICFGMGVWIGGLITYQAFEMTRSQKYPISLLTPGINKAEIFKALKGLAGQFNQTILVGYAPFIKDILDEMPDHGLHPKKMNMRFIFAAEAFTENFRDYLTTKTNVHNPLLDTMNIYGTADIGAMAFETPLAILIRRLAMKKSKLFESIFTHIDRTPTLAQYNPLFISFTERDDRLYVTGNNSIPFINYDLGDYGGVHSFAAMKEKLEHAGINLEKEAKSAGIGKATYELPFVYVYERVDLATTLYGLQIYPELIREALLENPFHKYFTGKMTLITKFNAKQNQYLEINLECRKNKKVSTKMKQTTLHHIVAMLRLKNSEFRELYTHLGKRALPVVVTWPYEDPLHFTPGVKQKWVKK